MQRPNRFGCNATIFTTARERSFCPAARSLLRYGHGQAPLGFALKLADFRREFNPGGEGDAAFASTVHLVDTELDLDESHEISMNEPLTHRQYTFYQSGFNESGHGREASVFSVAYDPGRPLKYAGSLMICSGIAIMFYMRLFLQACKWQQCATDLPRQ